jgi:hypothetical protein
MLWHEFKASGWKCSILSGRGRVSNIGLAARFFILSHPAIAGGEDESHRSRGTALRPSYGKYGHVKRKEDPQRRSGWWCLPWFFA